MSAMFVTGPLELLLALLLGGFGLPAGIPPAPEDPFLAQVAPEQCTAYVTWAGTAEPDAASGNQVEQLLAEPEVRRLFDAVYETVLEAARREARPGHDEPSPEELIKLVQLVLSRPAALFVGKVVPGIKPAEIEAAGVFAIGAETHKVDQITEWLQDRPGVNLQQIRIGNATFHRMRGPRRTSPTIYWGTWQQYLIVATSDRVIDRIIHSSASDTPEWLTRLRKQLSVPRPAAFAYLNTATLRELALGSAPEFVREQMRRGIAAVGLDNVQLIATSTGLDDVGIVSRTLIEIDGPPHGLLSLADTAPLTASDLQGIPADATFAVAFRLDAARCFALFVEMLGQVEPRAKREFLEELGRAEEHLDVNIRRDLLEPLGDVWRVYNSPGQGGLLVTGTTLVVDVDDADRLSGALEKFVEQVRKHAGRRRRRPTIDQLEFAGETIFVFNARDDDFLVAPSWCVTDSQLVVAVFPQNVKAYLAAGKSARSLAAVPEVAAVFQGPGPIKVAYIDSVQVFRLVYPLIQMVAQVTVAEMPTELRETLNHGLLPSAPAIERHLRPAVAAVRRTEAGIEVECRHSFPGAASGFGAVTLGVPWVAFRAGRLPLAAGSRTRSTNNLKQIALALHNYHDVYKTFPPAYSTDKEGKPLLSWRVHILPFVEQMALYDQFHLDEPWDSPHNRKLIEQMPPVYRAPGSRAGPGKTNYLGAAGTSGIFAGPKGSAIRRVVDGTSNTLMVVEVNDQAAVTWTKPGDFVPDPERPVARLLGLRRGGFLAAFCDGSVRLIPATIDRQTLQALFTRNGGEVIDWDSLER